MHPFERVGLGVPPYKFLGVEKNWFCAYPGDPGKPGGSCDYCGQGIAFEFWVRDARGKKFKVGCDCAQKLSREDAGQGSQEVFRDIQRAARDEARKKRDAARQRRASAAATALADLLTEETVVAALRQAPHPHPYYAATSTLADYVEWLREHGQSSKALAVVRHHLPVNGDSHA